MTEQQAYQAMFAFLEQHYERTRSDDIGALLGSLSLLSDGQPADSALEGDWSEAVQRALKGEVDTQMRLKR